MHVFYQNVSSRREGTVFYLQQLEMCQLQSCYSRDVSRMEGREDEQGGRESRRNWEEIKRETMERSLHCGSGFCFVFKIVDQKRSEVKRSFLGSFSIQHFLALGIINSMNSIYVQLSENDFPEVRRV